MVIHKGGRYVGSWVVFLRFSGCFEGNDRPCEAFFASRASCWLSQERAEAGELLFGLLVTFVSIPVRMFLLELRSC